MPSLVYSQLFSNSQIAFKTSPLYLFRTIDEIGSFLGNRILGKNKKLKLLLSKTLPLFKLNKRIMLRNILWANCFDNCFKTFVDKLFIKRPQLIKVKKKTLFLSLPYLGEISLKTRTKLRKSLKGLLDFCTLQIAFKSQRKLSNVFHLKDRVWFSVWSSI